MASYVGIKEKLFVYEIAIALCEVLRFGTTFFNFNFYFYFFRKYASASCDDLDVVEE